MFNDAIARMALREINRSGARFTWTNKQLNPVRSVLDRVFVSPEWDAQFPLASLLAETRIGSDHTPLVLDFGEGSQTRSKRFFFETGWLKTPGCKEMIIEMWHRLLEEPARRGDISTCGTRIAWGCVKPYGVGAQILAKRPGWPKPIS